MGDNLFHSFEQFNLDAGQIADIISNPSIENVLGRITGGDPSVINGLLQVTGDGSSSNLFLMNPAGIIFGPNSQVIVPGTLSVTTANSIQLGDFWFNALGSNDSASLVGTPSGFNFTGESSGIILNSGSLEGKSIALVGGTVISTNTLETPNGSLVIATVPGENFVRISQEGSLLSLDLPIDPQGNPEAGTSLTPLDLPWLLTHSELTQAVGLTIQDGLIRLTEGNEIVNFGDVITGDISAKGGIQIFANQNIYSGTISNSIGSIGSQRFGVYLNSEFGNIRVLGIKSESGGINIEAEGLFQATGVLENLSDDNNLSSENIPTLNIDSPENIDVKNFLIEQNILKNDGALNEEFLNAENGFFLKQMMQETWLQY